MQRRSGAALGLRPAGTQNEDEADEEPSGAAEGDSDLAEDDPGNNYKRLLREDVYGLDIDREFKFPHGRDKDIKKPAGWHRAVRMASEIHINEMRPQTYLHPNAIPSSPPIAFISLVPKHALVVCLRHFFHQRELCWRSTTTRVTLRTGARSYDETKKALARAER